MTWLSWNVVNFLTTRTIRVGYRPTLPITAPRTRRENSVPAHLLAYQFECGVIPRTRAIAAAILASLARGEDPDRIEERIKCAEAARLSLTLW